MTDRDQKWCSETPSAAARAWNAENAWAEVVAGAGCDEDSVWGVLRVGHELVDDLEDPLWVEALVALALDPPLAHVSLGEDFLVLAGLVFVVALRSGDGGGDDLGSHVEALVAPEPAR